MSVDATKCVPLESTSAALLAVLGPRRWRKAPSPAATVACGLLRLPSPPASSPRAGSTQETSSASLMTRCEAAACAASDATSAEAGVAGSGQSEPSSRPSLTVLESESLNRSVAPSQR